jgi:outer membrane protein assembly factor BamB
MRSAFFILLLTLGLQANAELQLEGSVITATSEENRPCWKYRADMHLFDPVITGGFVYLTGESGRMVALDAATGRVRWQFSTGDDWLYPPLVMGHRLILVGRNSGLYALTTDKGDILWHRPLTQEPIYAAVAAGSDHFLLPLFDGSLLLLSADTGQRVKRIRLPVPALNLAVKDDIALFSSYDQQLRAISIDDGRLLWQQELKGRLSRPAVIDDGQVEVTTDERVRYRFRLTTGTAVLPDTETGARSGNRPPPGNEAPDGPVYFCESALYF